MRCDDVRHRLLRCDPEELAGSSGTPLARHLRACGDCRRLAASLLEGERRLARALDAAAAGGDPSRAAERALAADDEGDEARRLPWRRWVPLAAAAGLVLAVLLPVRKDPDGELSLLPDAARRPAPEGFAVETPEGGPVTVLHTRDPDVTVVWFHRPPERSER